mmetsp:Transcript_2728/g.6300  ORF Transcript_2728/g.6300 Transcript_2728/m.6300 type:complete len:425 (+) Transcript_2728:146-1420(+)
MPGGMLARGRGGLAALLCFAVTVMRVRAVSSARPPAPPRPSRRTRFLPPYDVHTFFYLWYGNPETDGRYQHWNHKVLPHWTASVNARYEGVIGQEHTPPASIHSRYYPKRGCYSSRDTETLMSQFQEMKSAGIGIVVISWWGRPGVPGTSDTQGVNTDTAVSLVLEAAEKVGGIKVAFHLEPYSGRTAETIHADLRYIASKYLQSPAVYRHGHRQLPLYYVYDSYHITSESWVELLGTRSNRNVGPAQDKSILIREGPLDAIFIGLWLNKEDHNLLESFDGFYTYFSSTSFSYGSTLSTWKTLAQVARDRDQYFIPSVGPGYDDTRIRPWNSHNTRDREGGDYYSRMWLAALESNPSCVSITSYNEWGEGTQIEPADSLEMESGKASYLQYPMGDPYFFTNMTLDFAHRLRKLASEYVASHDEL